ncbi:MAG: hypothetical protein ACI39R_07675 [Lachnospiraceae bacterium]
MRPVKYICFYLFVIIIFLLSGECYQLFTGKVTIGYQINADTLSDSETEELLQYNGRGNLHMFVWDQGSVKTNIYCDKAMKDIFINDYQIVEGTVSSLFMGSTTYLFYDLSEYESNGKIENPYIGVWCPDENSDDLYEIYRRYGFDSEENYTYLGENGYALIFAGCIGVLLLLLFTYYECILERKQIFVRMTMGYSLKTQVFKKIVSNILIYIILLSSAILIMRNITYIFFVKKAMLVIFGVLLVADSLLYLCLLRMNARQVLADPFTNQRALNLNKAIYVISMVLTVLVTIKAAGEIREAKTYKEQYDFFEEVRDYSAVIINDGTTDLAQEYILEYESVLYSKFYEKYDVIQLHWGGSNASAENEREIKINDRTIRYLKEWIPELAEMDFEKAFYIILPENEEITSQKLKDWKKELYAGVEETEEPEIVTYSGKYKIPALDWINRIGLVEQPVILLSRNVQSFSDVTEAPNDYNRLQGCLIGAEEGELILIAEKYGLRLQVEHPWEVLQEEAAHRKLVLRVCMIIGAVMLFASIFVLGIVIRLTFAAEGKELCLKKILGYTHFEQMKSIYMIITENCLTALIITIGFYHDSLGEIIYATVCSAILFGISSVITIVMGGLMQSRSAVKILKGGAL